MIIRPLTLLQRSTYSSLPVGTVTSQVQHLRNTPRPANLFWSSNRAMTSSTTPSKQPSWSSGDEDNTALQESLNQQLSLGWRLTPNGMGLEKTFRFKTFKNTWAFMNAVAEDCKSNKHHPEWSNVYNTTFIRWTTHAPKGLSSKDITMVDICESHASQYSALPPVSEDMVEQTGETGRQLADIVATNAGDCCVPKAKPQKQ